MKKLFLIIVCMVIFILVVCEKKGIELVVE